MTTNLNETLKSELKWYDWCSNLFHVSRRTLRPAMMLMMEMLTPSQDTRNEMRTGNLAKAAIWQPHD